MRSSKSRSRNKSNRQRTLGNVLNRVFDSSGPEGKVRGTPQQIIDKYLTLARDAQLSNDRVAEQSFFQHAEHYTRMLGEAQREMAERQQHYQHQNNRQNGEDDGENGGRDHSSRDHENGQQNGQQNGQRSQEHDLNGSEQAQPEQDRTGSDAPRPVVGDQPAEPAQKPTTVNRRSGANHQPSGIRRQGRGRNPAQGADQEPAISAPDQASASTADQPGSGLPDVIGSSDDSGPVETPETSRVRKPRAKSAAGSRSPRAPRKKAQTEPVDSGDVPVTQTHGLDDNKS